MTVIDMAFAKARAGSRGAFESWMGLVERPIRLSLARFARAVDVEGVVQETLMRMWILAGDAEKSLEGENASLRFAIALARNVARAEARRNGRMAHLPAEDLPEPVAPSEPPPDPGLRKAILECLDTLMKRPREALLARLRLQHLEPDATIAARLGMTLNTFLQNIVRARRKMVECLDGKGIRLREILP